jgi:hypothetical protein
MLYCFVDTNIFIQFEMFDQVDWPAILGVDEACLVIPKTVIQELDKFKTDPSSNRRRKRARKILPKILDLANPPDQDVSIREGSYLRILTTNPLRSWLLENGYDPDDADDRIVGATQSFQEDNPELSVVILADDAGVKLKARAVGIEVRVLPDNLELPEEPDPQQKKLQELRHKVIRLENAQPNLEIGFNQGDEIVNEVTFSIDFGREKWSPDEIIILVGKKRKELELSEDFDLGLKIPTEEEEKHLKTMGDYIRGGFTASRTAKEIEAHVKSYPKRLEDYLQSYQQYLFEQNALKVRSLRARRLSFVLSNVGTSPANDIDIEVHFPDGFEVIERLPRIPNPPDPPAKPGSAGFFREIHPLPSFSQSPILPISPISSHYSGPPSRRGPIIRETNSYTVEYYLDSLKHNYTSTLKPILLTFDVPDQLPTGFEVSYWIASANIPDPIEGKLAIRLVETADS